MAKKNKLLGKDYIDEIVDLRLKKGFAYQSLLTHLITKYNLSKSYAYQLIRESYASIEENSIKCFEKQLNQDIQRFENLMELSINAGNLKEARENLKEIARLKGHYIERTEMTVIEYKAKFGTE